jgi:hypothetical protein
MIMPKASPKKTPLVPRGVRQSPTIGPVPVVSQLPITAVQNTPNVPTIAALF